MPLVSVLLPVFNGGATLATAIRSIQDQTFQDWELLIIDNGSSDETASVVREAACRDKRIVPISLPPVGITRALNHGLGVARGEFIARQDADDASVATRLERQLLYLYAHPATLAVGTWAQCIDHADMPYAIFAGPGDQDSVRRSFLQRTNPIIHGSVCFRRAPVITAGFTYRGGYVEDLDLWLRMLELGDIAIIESVEYLYRVNPAGLSLQNLVAQAKLRRFVFDLAARRRRCLSEDVSYEAEVERILSPGGSSLTASSGTGKAFRHRLAYELRRGAQHELRRVAVDANRARQWGWWSLAWMLSSSTWLMSLAVALLSLRRGIGLRSSRAPFLARWFVMEERREHVPEASLPEVAVILPVFNERPNFLYQAVQSILYQEGCEVAVFILDDGSDDPQTQHALDELSSLSRRVTVIRYPRRGLTETLIDGMRQLPPRYAWIARQDSDDFSHPKRLKDQLAVLTAQPSLGVVATGSEVVNSAGRFLWRKRLPLLSRLNEVMKQRNPFAHGSLCFRRRWYEESGGYDPRFLLAQDYELMLRAERQGAIGILPLPRYCLRLHSQAISFRRRALQDAYAVAAREQDPARRATLLERCHQLTHESLEDSFAQTCAAFDEALYEGSWALAARRLLVVIRVGGVSPAALVRVVRWLVFPLPLLRQFLFR